MKKYLSTLFVLSLAILLVGCGTEQNTTKDHVNNNEPSQEESTNTQTAKLYTDFDGNNMIELTFDADYIKVEPDFLMEPQYDFYFTYLDPKGTSLELSVIFDDAYQSKEEFYNNFLHLHEDNYTNVKGSEITTKKVNGLEINTFKITYDWEGEGENKETGKMEYMSGTSDSKYNFVILENGNFMILNANNLEDSQYEDLFKKLFIKVEVVK